MADSENGNYLAEVVGTAPDDVAHVDKEWRYASILIMAIMGPDEKKCPLIFLEDKGRLTLVAYVKYLCYVMLPCARTTNGER